MTDELSPRAIARELARIGTEIRTMAAGLADGDAVTGRDIDKADGWAHRIRSVMRGQDPA